MKSLIVVLLAVVSVACSSSTKSSSSGACFKAGDRICPNDTPLSQRDADSCGRCLADYQTLLACDPNAGFICVNGQSETSKDLTCKSQIDAFEECFVHSSSDASVRD